MPAAWLGAPQPGSTLFPTAEKVSSLGKNWHPFCLKCERCHSVLSPGGHAEVRPGQSPYPCVCHCPPGTSSVAAWRPTKGDLSSPLPRPPIWWAPHQPRFGRPELCGWTLCLWRGRRGQHHCSLTCSCPVSLTAVAILARQPTPDPSQPHQPRPVDRHTWQSVWGEGPWGTGQAPLGPEQPPFLCLCLAQREAILPQAMLWGSIWTQG